MLLAGCVVPLDAGFECPPVVFNEFLTKNESYPDEKGIRGDWVELYNASDRRQDLTGFLLLVDGIREEWAWELLPDAQAIVGPHSHYVLSFDGIGVGAHAPFKLNREFGRLTLLGPIDAGEPTCDDRPYEMQHVDWAEGRHPDGADTWRIERPTRGERNGP